MVRSVAFLAMVAFVAARSVPASADERAYLDAMGVATQAPKCGGCGCEFCCTSSCDSRCGAGKVCDSVGCVACDCVATMCITALAKVEDADFCLPPVFTVTVATWDAAASVDAANRIVRHDGNANLERIDFFDAQFGAGDVVTGYAIRHFNSSTEWLVKTDTDGKVTGCTKGTATTSHLPKCLATGAHYAGQGTQGGAAVSFWRQMVGVNTRVDLVVVGGNNSTDAADVGRVTRVSPAGFAIDDLFNFNVKPIAAAAFEPPAECPQ